MDKKLTQKAKQLKCYENPFKRLANMLLARGAVEYYVPLKDDERVKLNYEKIKALPDYPDNMQTQYVDFVEKNKDRIFTVKTVPKFGPDHTVVTFNEDDTWLFADVILERLDSKRYGDFIDT